MQNCFCGSRKGKVDRDGNEDIITISCKIKFIDMNLLICKIYGKLIIYSC